MDGHEAPDAVGAWGVVLGDASSAATALARELAATGRVSDPWVGGLPRFGVEPCVLSTREGSALGTASERVMAVLDEVNRVVMAEPELLSSFFKMTPMQRLLWHASAPAWHGYARADVFFREGDGGPPVVCEINCDTPSGFAEALCTGPAPAGSGLLDPNADLARAMKALLGHFLARHEQASERPTVGIVYPTDLGGDFDLIALFQRWLSELGCKVVLGAPANLTPHAAGVALFGEPCALILRHYKTDWWGERQTIWADQTPYGDPAPLVRPLEALLGAAVNGQVSVVNPFGAVLLQNKRVFAFCWEELSRLSAESQATVRELLPFTVRLETAELDALTAAREDWVLKSDYGCEGEEVIVGREVDQATWERSLLLAHRERWVAQRYFQARRDQHGRAANHGVFLVAGASAGLYTRLSAGATDHRALSVPTWIRDENERNGNAHV